VEKRLYVTSILLIAVCLAWLFPFSCILIYGTHVVQEPNPFILYGELLLFISFMGFAISNIILLLKK